MAREPLTTRQQAIFDFIKENIDERKIPPAVREIGREFGIASANGVMSHLRSLERKGWIRREENVARGITIVEEEKTFRDRVICHVEGIDGLDVHIAQSLNHSAPYGLTLCGMDFDMRKEVGNEPELVTCEDCLAVARRVMEVVWS